MEQHERYEELAVGHVLGGLDAADAADFRSHLLGCRDCRLRVAELRDIADELAAAEREERAEARVRTEVARDVEQVQAEVVEPRPLLSSRQLGVAAVLAVCLLGLLAFWNLHLRTQNVAHVTSAERSSATLRELAEGVPVVTSIAPPTSGMVVVDGDEVAFTFAALPPLGPDERYVLWLLGTEEGDQPVLVGVPDEHRALAGLVADEGAAELLLTIETEILESGPRGREVARADLARATDG